MIASLRGRVGGRIGNAVVVDVNGVGYLVQASAGTLRAMGSPGDAVEILVHTQVREDAITLFGFADAEEREVFLMLVGVQGVGPKLALAILSALSPPNVLASIALDDRKSLCLADGVGPRVAVRLCTELKAKAVQARGATVGGEDIVVRGRSGDHAAEEARGALVQLGYGRIEAGQMLSAVMASEMPPTDTASILSACLRAASARAA